jgi:hypothetical protein
MYVLKIFVHLKKESLEIQEMLYLLSYYYYY